jgi:hypothetical protein
MKRHLYKLLGNLDKGEAPGKVASGEREASPDAA